MPSGPQYVGTSIKSPTADTPRDWPTVPTKTRCPNCHQDVTSQVSMVNGKRVWILVIALALTGFILGCCLIPLCIPNLKDVEHHCPYCHALIGTKKRI